MENNIIWIKENDTNNIYCCEIVESYFGQIDIVYDVNCIIGTSFTQVRIPRYCNLYAPSPCEMRSPYRVEHNGYFVIYTRVCSKGTACFDIEKLK